MLFASHLILRSAVMFPTLGKQWRNRWGQNSKSKRRQRPVKKGRRPWLEPLEDRLAPAFST